MKIKVIQTDTKMKSSVISTMTPNLKEISL